MAERLVQVGAPDPERKSSPIIDDEEDLTLDLKDRAGVAKKADTKVFMTPRLIGLNDQSLMINKILVDLRNRLQSQGDPITDSVIRNPSRRHNDAAK